jgi:hypothetical protein
MPDPTNSELTTKEYERFIRALRLVEAWTNSAPTVIDGITFRLDCDVDKSQWHPLCPLGLYGDGTALYGPELVFPWTPKFVREALSKHERLVKVTKGCTVLVGSVTSQRLATTFADFANPDQRNGKLVHLLIIRPSGDIYSVKRPLILLRSTATDALITAGDYKAAFGGLVEQLQDRVGLPDFDSFIDEPIETWPKPQKDFPEIYARALLAFLRGYRTLDHEPYVAFGYLMGKAEGEAQLLAAANKGRNAIQTQARAAGGRHLKSRQETEKLRIIATQLVKRDPDMSLTRCAREVEDIVGSDPDWPFKSDAKWIARHIKELFERRANGREYRPKRLS